MLDAIKKYSPLIHLMVLASVYAVYYAFPPYGIVGNLFLYIFFLGIFYGVLVIFSVKDSIEKRDRKLLYNAAFYFLIGQLIFLAETIRTAGH